MYPTCPPTQAFEAYDQTSSKSSSVSCLQYLILCKVLNDSAAEVPAILTSKIGMKHSGIELEAMATIAKASKIRSLEDFQTAVLCFALVCLFV
jgi:26S proteasome regulatory subunit N6